MAAMYRLKGLGWLTSCAMVAIGFYLVSSQVAAERKRVEQLDRKIVGAERDIRALETEFDVRANLAQLERWNGDTLALTVPTAAQFVRDEAALASLSPNQPVPAPLPGAAAPVQTAQLIVPAAATAVTASAAPAPAVPATVRTAAAAPVATVKVAAAKPAAAPRLTPTAVAAAAPAGASAARAAKVAMLDRALLSETTVGDLLSRARTERGRLR
ncbi:MULTISPECIES: hypothetical protein [unclassified Sphingomonas]|uniref:hypothetical protein n=1 Tax=unclassified Sphingomonas TaxID=196159 RepID=UPI0017E4D5FE|nr:MULTISPECIES: hypothetical protein [unclassified Sphingomonas]MBB3348536.1 hypothetical protein [Sphingomonas sp. BK069]MBB3474909.1 hypothetical protein [Sphingomonas sp. BK345]